MKYAVKILLLVVILLSYQFSANAETQAYDFSGMFNRHGSVMLIIDAESGAIIDANQAAVAFYGFTREQLLTMNIKEINRLPPEKVEQEWRAAAGEKRSYFLFLHRLSNGEMRNVEVYSYPFERDGKVLLYSIIHDITAKKHLEEAVIVFAIIQLAIILFLVISLRNNRKTQGMLEKSKQKYESLFENMQEGVVLCDVVYENTGKPVELKIIDANKAYEKITQSKRYEVLNRTVTELFPQYKSDWIKGSNEVLSSGKSMQFDIYLKDSTRYCSVNLFGSEKGKIAVVFSDVTEDRMQKEKLNAANKELIAVNTLRDKLFSVITKDVREPLAILVNLSELLVEEMKNDFSEKGEMVNAIQEYVMNAFTMADNLLEWYRTKKEMEVYRPMNWELHRLIQEATQMIKAGADAKSITIMSSIPELIKVYADRDMLDVVLRNLLSNAVKYTHRSGNVIITADEEKEMIVVSVNDTGAGIHPEKVQLLFQDVRDNATPGTDGEMGIGVGLFICRRFIQINGGDIWVDSTPGEGSCFFISIPKGI